MSRFLDRNNQKININIKPETANAIESPIFLNNQPKEGNRFEFDEITKIVNTNINKEYTNL